MKKIGLFIMALFLVISVSGCGSKTKKDDTKTLTCTNTEKGDGMTAVGSAEYKFSGKKLKTVKATFTFKDFEIDNIDKVWKEITKQLTEQNDAVKDNGYVRTVKTDDKKHTFTVIIDIDFNKISKETMEKYEVEDYSDKTYEDLLKEAEDTGMTCK